MNESPYSSGHTVFIQFPLKETKPLKNYSTAQVAVQFLHPCCLSTDKKADQPNWADCKARTL